MAHSRVYKILSDSDWIVSERLGRSQTALDERDGYVHLSARDQVAETLALHYAGATEVRLLEFDAETLGGDLRWEASRGGQLFPHLYGPLPLAGAKRRWTLTNHPDGRPALPSDIDDQASVQK